ncbi:SDR family oxidoreductase [Labrys wisconsinensis]|uniref:NAD(P)-dependent dehydrogenase (Short-subunit alcohol dehydrogenase family) n=1 Tax=Labrys wisconsinensis TaxID=425677 RepID=A0ABU0J5J3_9HYPH|nr:SDR family oxidoreductase [Labrys wisconsinensis]MDQ0468733.1 NAD(P)-dependent dehydrogenase (short-subunit alcohol dehydrogenase family) [Labrys wisconsinensis]
MSSQHAVIVGGSSGIGLATARHLMALGLAVTIAGRSEPRLQAARQALGGDVSAVVIDAADGGSVQRAFAQIGTFDHLVLALGSSRGLGPFATIDPADMRLGFEEKVFPHFACAQAAMPHLRKDGSIVFVAAVSAHAAVPGTSGIGAANAAVAALVPTLAAELRPLRVNGVSPGLVDTPWWDFLPQEQKTTLFAQYVARTPVGRIGRPEDVAQAIAFLICSDFMDGVVIVCDGGLRLAA